jgi:hypothetical protein
MRRGPSYAKATEGKRRGWPSYAKASEGKEKMTTEGRGKVGENTEECLRGAKPLFFYLPLSFEGEGDKGGEVTGFPIRSGMTLRMNTDSSQGVRMTDGSGSSLCPYRG